MKVSSKDLDKGPDETQRQPQPQQTVPTSSHKAKMAAIAVVGVGAVVLNTLIGGAVSHAFKKR
jgi:hypothetical protein